MAESVTVGRSDEVPEGEATAFEAAGQTIAVARLGDRVLAFSDICTHRGCNLSMGGEIDGNAITCECHGSVFDMTTGAVLEGPATEPIATFAVREENGDLVIEV